MDEKKIDLLGKADLIGISGEWAATMGGAYVIIGNPLDNANQLNAELRTKPFYVCPKVGDDDLPIEGSAEVTVKPPTGSFKVESKHKYQIEWAIPQEIAKELVGLLLGAVDGGGLPKKWVDVPKWLNEQARDKELQKLLEFLAEVKRTLKIEAFASAYQAIFQVNGTRSIFSWVDGRTVGGNDSESGKLGKEVKATWKSLGRPRYQLATGAAVSVIVVGPYDEILYYHLSAAATVELSDTHWQIIDKNDKSNHDPEPNSTWL